MTQPCRLSAMAMVNALGREAAAIWPRLLAGDQSHIRTRADLVPDRDLLFAEVAGDLPQLPEALRRYACRNNALSLLALEQLATPIGRAIAKYGAERVGVVMGTSTSGVADAEIAIRHQHDTGELGPGFDYAQLEFGGAAAFVAELLGVCGPVYTISTACSSGARALVSARSLLALGLCDAVIAGATDTLCGLTANGFSALKVVSDEITNPCSENRKGLTLGEGSVMFLATGDSGGVQLRGIGESSEAHHMSAPDPAGGGAEAAMRAALADAQLAPEDIVYLNLHGTGTALNDAMECAAIARTFASPPPASSTKSLVGHTLGAAGALEAGFCWMMQANADAEGIAVPPHVYDGAWDAALPALPLVTKGLRVAPGPIMTNSFGFGGNNCTLILSREAE